MEVSDFSPKPTEAIAQAYRASLVLATTKGVERSRGVHAMAQAQKDSRSEDVVYA
ncbi:MAG: hypothetical protein F6J92_03020, partial [Symploca sp. SIO1A3]|nr:hypothetical protein [Symploca sp. SIO1A3]